MPRGWLSGWTQRRRGGQGAAAALYLSERGVAVARGERKAGGYRVAMGAYPVAAPGQLGAALQEAGRAARLGEGTCHLVLAPGLYSMTLLERPPVADDELRDAMRWRIDDHIDFPASEAVIDVFPLPESASRERAMVFVVAMRRDRLTWLLDTVHGAGIEAGCVDVCELAMRNVARQLLPEPDRPLAVLWLTPSSGVINVTRGDELFLSRRISGMPERHTESAWRDFAERLLLQVQRSIDYFESAMGQPPCSALLVAATQVWQAPVLAHLDEMLPLPVRALGAELPAAVDLVDLAEAEADARALAADTLAGARHEWLTLGLPAIGGVLADDAAAPPGLEQAA